MKLIKYFLLTMLLLFHGCNDDHDDKQKMHYVIRTVKTTPPGITHTVFYDARGLITEISNFDNGWIGTTFEYDNKGNLTSGSNWHFTYDAANRLTKIVAGERTDILRYNAYGQLNDITFKFDMGGSIITINYSFTYPDTRTKNFSKVTYDYGATEEVEYENTTNPFQNNWMQLGAAGFLNWDRLCYHTDSNIKRITMTYGLTTAIYRYHYTYNENRYPTKVIMETTIKTMTDTTITESNPLDLTYFYR